MTKTLLQNSLKHLLSINEFSTKKTVKYTVCYVTIFVQKQYLETFPNCC